MTIQPKTNFEALAQGAAYCREFSGSFVLYTKGDKWHAEDAFDTLEAAAIAFEDCWGDWEDQQVLEFAPSGAFVDVTDEAMKRAEAWCEERGDVAPWAEAA